LRSAVVARPSGVRGTIAAPSNRKWLAQTCSCCLYAFDLVQLLPGTGLECHQDVFQVTDLVEFVFIIRRQRSSLVLIQQTADPDLNRRRGTESENFGRSWSGGQELEGLGICTDRKRGTVLQPDFQDLWQLLAHRLQSFRQVFGHFECNFALRKK